MRIEVRPGLMVALIGATCALEMLAQKPSLSSANVEQVDRLVTKFMPANHVPGLSIAIVMNGELVWSKGYGVADLENQVRATAATAYRSASIGKPMTATAAMQLADAGKLDLDAEIQKYCPAFPRKEQKITARHLLSHLSGIRHYGGPRDKEEQSSTTHYANVVDALAPFKDDPLLFPPGTRFGYSTYGYDVLGCVVEGAAGVPYLRYMKEHVWDPSGMAATRDDDPSALIPNRAGGYVLVNGTIRRAQIVDMSNRLPAGGFVTTVDDLAKFAAALMGDRLVRHATLQQMFTPALLPGGKKIPYGLGWAMELEEWHGDTWIAHGGSSPGVSGILALMPRHRFAVAILTNLEDIPGDARNDLAAAVASTILEFGSGAKN